MSDLQCGNQLIVPEQRVDSQTGIRVCHIASGDLWAGAEVQACTVIKELAKRNDIEVCAILMNEGRLAEELRSVPVPLRVIDERRNGFPELVKKATHWVERQQIQVLHSHRYKENLLAVLLAKTCSVPYVVRTQHGMPEPFSGVSTLRQGIAQAIDWGVARLLTDRIVAVTEELRDQLGARLGSRERIVVIHNGLKLGEVASTLSKSEAKARLGLLPETPVIATVSRLVPIKRLDLFIKAASVTAQFEPASQFVIAGDGPERQSIQALIEKEGLVSKVLLLGQCQTIYDVIRAADVLVLTSDHEGLPMVLLEAMQLGTPIVARRVGGLPEVLDPDCGVLVPSPDPNSIAQAILHLIHDEVSRNSIIDRAKVRVHSFSAELCAERLISTYRSVLNEHKR